MILMVDLGKLKGSISIFFVVFIRMGDIDECWKSLKNWVKLDNVF